MEKFRQQFSDAEQDLIKTYHQNAWPGKLEKFRQRFSDAEQGLIKTYDQNDWPGKLEKFRQWFSDVEQGLIKSYPQNRIGSKISAAILGCWTGIKFYNLSIEQLARVMILHGQKYNFSDIDQGLSSEWLELQQRQNNWPQKFEFLFSGVEIKPILKTFGPKTFQSSVIISDGPKKHQPSSRKVFARGPWQEITATSY